jgi:hypothetical protein
VLFLDKVLLPQGLILFKIRMYLNIYMYLKCVRASVFLNPPLKIYTSGTLAICLGDPQFCVAAVYQKLLPYKIIVF